MYVWAAFFFFRLQAFEDLGALGLEGVGLKAFRANIYSKGSGCGA